MESLPLASRYLPFSARNASCAAFFSARSTIAIFSTSRTFFSTYRTFFSARASASAAVIFASFICSFNSQTYIVSMARCAGSMFSCCTCANTWDIDGRRVAPPSADMERRAS